MHYKRADGPPSRDSIGPRVMCLSKLIRDGFNRAAADQGLFSGQQDIVLALVENEGVTLGTLAKMLDVSTATMSVSVKRMEKAGFIRKAPDKTDARIVRLYPTDKAKLAPVRIKAQMDEIDRVIRKGMTQRQTEELSALLDAAIKNVSERGDA